jgi:hypothetical protein
VTVYITASVLNHGRAPRAYARTGSTGGLPTLYNPVYFPISKGPTATLLLSVSKELPYAAKKVLHRASWRRSRSRVSVSHGVSARVRSS